MNWLYGADSDEAVIKPEELEDGFNPCRMYPFGFIKMVINNFDNTGVLLNQDEAKSFDPAYLSDIGRMMRWRSATQKEQHNEDIREQHRASGVE